MPRRIAQYLMWVFTFFVVIMLHETGASAYARVASGSEAALKAGYIYNFMKFVEWPSSLEGQNFNVCVLGNDPFSSELGNLNGKLVRGRPIQVIADVTLPHARYCHVVFVSRSEAGRLTNALLRLRQTPILTVSDIAGFTDKGGVIELITNQTGEINFRVSKKSAEDVGLRVSSKLLSLSR